MNEDDLRDCFAMFAMAGMLMKGNEADADIPVRAYQFADVMLEARKQKENDAEEDVGIASVKRIRKTK
jgi:hypothetical protein